MGSAATAAVVVADHHGDDDAAAAEAQVRISWRSTPKVAGVDQQQRERSAATQQHHQLFAHHDGQAHQTISIFS